MSVEVESSAPAALLAALAAGDLDQPHQLLGPQRCGEGCWTIRAYHPNARAAECLLEDGRCLALAPVQPDGLFEGRVQESEESPRYRLRFHFETDEVHEQQDPYRFPTSLNDVDLYLFAEGNHRGLWHLLGAHEMEQDGVSGVRFAVWAPRARRVSVVGEFCLWDGRRLPMTRHGHSGVFELFVPEVPEGALYKFEIRTAEGELRPKTDPFAFAMERSPGTASRVFRSRYRWGDDAWLAKRREADPRREPMAIYEVHAGSWQSEGSDAPGYRELAERLVKHAERFGFTHVELLPITEYPFDGSWGYQVSGYYAPTARYGSPDDFRAFVDICHRAGIGVVLDWVPAHFPRDDFALRRFDGGPLYEYSDPRLGEHPDWGTLVFDYGRNEVRNFLIANALYWLQEFHLDGLRVDAVASMLYRDYSRAEGDWIPNVHGGRENLEAVDFLCSLNRAVREEAPGCFTVAEESTAWPGVSRPEHEGGLGFTFKWNLGWMHDTLSYLARDPAHRPFHHDQLTFASLYENTEHFLMPLSHDEVVHGKGSLLAKMPGDPWQQFANLRLLFTYQYTRPGKKLLFMGSELAPDREWDYRQSLDWSLAQDPARAGLSRLLEVLGRLYRTHPCFWAGDPDPGGFSWIDCSDREQSVVSYLRSFGSDEMVMVFNFTPVPRPGYRVGLPHGGSWSELLSSDAEHFGGSGHPTRPRLEAEAVPMHGRSHSASLTLPPLAALVLAPGEREPFS